MWTLAAGSGGRRKVDDFLLGRREAGRQHEIGPVREVARARAVLVHQHQPLAAVVPGARLRDEDDAAVEIAFLAGDLLVDGVGDLVSEAAPVFGQGGVCHAHNLLLGEHVPEPEQGMQAAVRLHRGLADDQQMSADNAPIVEIRGEGRRLPGGRGTPPRNGAEEAGPLQVGADDIGDVVPETAASLSAPVNGTIAAGTGSGTPSVMSIVTCAVAGNAAAKNMGAGQGGETGAAWSQASLSIAFGAGRTASSTTSRAPSCPEALRAARRKDGQARVRHAPSQPDSCGCSGRPPPRSR